MLLKKISREVCEIWKKGKLCPQFLNWIFVTAYYKFNKSPGGKYDLSFIILFSFGRRRC